MLDIRDATNLMDEIWDKIELNTRLPEQEADYFAVKGPVPENNDNKRRFHRFYYRGKAIITRQGAFLGVYTKDVSRQGVGFLSPVQLQLKERIQLRATGANRLELEVTRCRPVGEQCFECGAKFVK
jgi:PilZ domain-containing protein